jgi:hypothetical protein
MEVLTHDFGQVVEGGDVCMSLRHLSSSLFFCCVSVRRVERHLKVCPLARTPSIRCEPILHYR